MSIRASEEALFEEWGRGREGFVKDGVADEDAYASSRPRLLLVLQETPHPESGGKDLRQLLRRGGCRPAWDGVVRWVRCIRALPEEVPWSELKDIPDEARPQLLRSVAAISLQKRFGSFPSRLPSRRMLLVLERELLRRQIELYRADLILCCGVEVARAMDVILYGGREPEPWRETSRGVRYRELEPGRYVIGYLRPETRLAENALCYGLVDAVRELYWKTGPGGTRPQSVGP